MFESSHEKLAEALMPTMELAEHDFQDSLNLVV
jgi:hypothetical protein